LPAASLPPPPEQKPAVAASAGASARAYAGYRRCAWVGQFDAYGNYLGRIRTCNYY